ncbi:ribokinase [Paenarthrobacter aromaticivorans]|uniref:Ribokinase n=1 Tax=Paenarthrobacter aromaticivorans TaxID=2849150 RepID=A0ABS6I8W6_9MICC|nr:ribokinase [Paenarthrobacter sp. MMS21-TAE1-1]MBU8868049.1 ribokinase [Paenarthrobacter sp. MMS21-TAE1-1]
MSSSPQSSAPILAPASTALTVVGSINLDIAATASRLPTPGETVGGAVLRQQPGGKGANQAVAAARLAGASRMVGAVGRDEAGRSLLEAMASAGVDVQDIAQVDAATGTALVLVDSEGENQIVVCPGANGEVTVDGVSFAEEEAVLCQLEVDQDVVLEAARRTKGYFALNAAPAAPIIPELLERCDLVIVNETEYALIPALRTAPLVAVTYGGEGSAIFEHGERVAEAPAVRVTEIANTIGAGDAFCAALVLALRSGLEHSHALAVANAVGADAVRDASSQPALKSLEHYVEATRTSLAV